MLIWARGLPFVPPPEGRPAAEELSVAIAVYKDGQEHFYALQSTADARPSSAGGPELRIGRSTFRFEERGGAVTLRAKLDLDVAGCSRVRGTVEVCGAPARIDAAGGGPLGWAPVSLAARGRAELTWDEGTCSLSGPAYFDGNWSERPLWDLGIRDWRWGRVALPGRDLVYFVLSPEERASEGATLVLTVDEDGRGVPLSRSAVFEDGLPGWFGLRRIEALTLRGEDDEIVVDFVDQVEDGPFYQRYLIEAKTRHGERGRGVAERVVPARLKQVWHRPLVNMRVDRVGAKPSVWLPLFSGAARGRVRRLVSTWWRGSGRAEVRP